MAIEKPPSRCGSRVFLVTRRGFEPRTHCLKGRKQENAESLAYQRIHVLME